MVLLDVRLKLHCGELRSYDGVETTIDHERNIYMVTGKNCLRFMCHLDDIIFLDEIASPMDDMQEQIIQTAVSQGKIQAIKDLRNHSGLGLKEAKDQVEKWLDERGLKAKGY